MLTEKDTIKCEAIFNDDRTHRFSWKRVWNKDKPLCAVIMLNPSLSDNIMTDTTTTLVVNNVARLESFGGVVIVNLYSILTNKLNFRWNSDDDLNAKENDHYIMKAAEECEAVIIAWGKAGEHHPRIMERVSSVLDILSPYREKFLFISDGERNGLHPLTPTIRSEWILKTYDDIEAEKAITEEQMQESSFEVTEQTETNESSDESNEALEKINTPA